MLSLYHGDRKVGEGRIKTQPGYFELAGEGLCVGRDSGAAGHRRLPGRAARTGSPAAPSSGSPIDVSGEPYLDLEREAAGHARPRVAKAPAAWEAGA